MSSVEPVIISVTGAHSGVGKTSLCSLLLRELDGYGAIKFTKTPLYASLVDDYSILSQKGKDTALFLESGAQRVLWIQSPYHELSNLLNLALSRMADVRGIIVEGNSPVDFMYPHLIIFIVSLKGEIKPSAVKVSKKADIVIVNSEEKSIDFLHFVSPGKKDAKIFWIDLSHKKGELNEFLCHVKERINKKPHQGKSI
jgi:molybdopterin-guanine dinucleotide biosynthesis protein